MTHLGSDQLMQNTNIPTDRELPSTAKLIRSTFLAVGGAAFLLVGVVMPAEYGMDPIGVGKLTGLQEMGEIKMSLAREAEAERLAKGQASGMTPQPAPEPQPQPVAQNTLPAPVEATDAPSTPAATAASRRDTTTVSLQPNEGNEVKVDLKKGEVVKFVWASDGGKVNFDNHADSKALNINYHGYGKGTSTREEGIITAAFDGEHGWFWRNRSAAPLTITIQTEGPYTAIRRVK
jgi:hypothetical protein